VVGAVVSGAPVQVECYAGCRGAETPRCFAVAAAKIEIAEVHDRWLTPDHRYFKVRDGAGAAYVLRDVVASELWQLTLLRRTGGAEPVSPPTESAVCRAVPRGLEKVSHD
jgi:hypothetical protein